MPQQELSTLLGAERVVTVGGVDYTISPPTLGMFKKASAKLRQARLGEAKELIDSFPECKEREAMVRNLLRPVTDYEVQQYMSAADGALYVTWLCLNKNHPELTEEAFLSFSAEAFHALTTAREAAEEEDAPKKRGRPAKKKG